MCLPQVRRPPAGPPASGGFTLDDIWVERPSLIPGKGYQPKGGVPVEKVTALLRDPSMTDRLPSGAVSAIRTSLAP